MLPSVKETFKVISERSTNWCFVPAPHPAWAALVHPDLLADEAYEQLRRASWSTEWTMIGCRN